MNDSHELESQLDQLGHALGKRPSVVESVMAEIESVPIDPVSMHKGNSTWKAIGLKTISVAAAACVLIAAAALLLQPKTLNAKALEALKRVNSIHVTGWSSQVARSWKLETDAPPTGEQHDVEMWFWRNVDGTAMGYEKCGPVVKLQTDDSVKEYQSDADLLYLAEGRNSRTADDFATLATYLRELEGATREDLGTKTVDGKLQQGVRVSHHSRVSEYWFDASSNLPLTFSRKQTGDQAVAFELQFTYDEQVPANIVSYTPPKAKHVRYGGHHKNVSLAWKQHVQDLWQQETPIDGGVRVVKREGRQSFDHQWLLQTPDEKYFVAPIDRDQYEAMNIDHFIRLLVARSNTNRAAHTWRVEGDGLLDIEFPRCDLIYSSDTPWQKWVQFFLNEHGLEYTDVVEQRTHWIAEHDGQKLKPSWKVKPPKPYLVRNGKPQIGAVRTGIGTSGSPETLLNLFDDFNTTQNRNYQANHPIIVDATGLPKPPEWDQEKYPKFSQYREEVVKEFFVASDSPYFDGEKGQEMAREWYESEFGITFKEEKRPMTIHVIRKKQ